MFMSIRVMRRFEKVKASFLRVVGVLWGEFSAMFSASPEIDSRMREISIAESIIDIAEAKAREQNSLCVQAIKIRLGEFTTVAREALEFAFEVVRQGTLADHARLEIEIVPMVVDCVLCGPIADPIREICLICPQCGLPLKIVSGEELQVEYIEIQSQADREPWNASLPKQMY
jgi:hydrogenase nickel incorporation protein HypA/HybF